MKFKKVAVLGLLHVLFVSMIYWFPVVLVRDVDKNTYLSLYNISEVKASILTVLLILVSIAYMK